MQCSQRIAPVWPVILIVGLTSISCATRKNTVFDDGGLPPLVSLSQLDSISKESITNKLHISYAQLPLSFAPNHGQADEHLYFLSCRKGMHNV